MMEAQIGGMDTKLRRRNMMEAQIGGMDTKLRRRNMKAQIGEMDTKPMNVQWQVVYAGDNVKMRVWRRIYSSTGMIAQENICAQENIYA